MANYKTFNISLSTQLDNGSAKAIVCFSDDETEFEDTIEYVLDIDEIDRLGGKYVDNVAEFLLNKATGVLIEQKKKYRESILNIYDIIDNDI